MKLKDMGEIGLIKRLARNARYDSSIIKGVGDDAAVMKWAKGKYLLFTCDMLVEGEHFIRNRATPFQIGWKALCRNISDIAAMGGVPRYALASIGISPREEVSFFDGIYKGMSAAAAKFNVNLVGGDISRSEKIVIDVSLIGEVERKNLVLRSGAKAGDAILVTGSIGGASKGKHLDFIPRLDEARSIVKRFKINSMIDISDGLALDLGRILEASNAGAIIYQNTVPLSQAAGPFNKAISEGEDFELLFTMAPKEAGRFFRTALADMKTSVTLIGEIKNKGYGYKLVTGEGVQKDLKLKGYLHF